MSKSSKYLGTALLLGALTSGVLIPAEADKKDKDKQASPAAPAISTEQVNLIKAHFQKAERLRSMIESQDAINEYTLALNLDPHFMLAVYGRGLAYLDLENNRKAVADLESIDKACPKYVDALKLAGMARCRMLDYKAAKSDYDRILLLKNFAFDKPDYHHVRGCDPWEILNYRAHCYLMMKQPELAKKDSDQAAKMAEAGSIHRVWALRNRARSEVLLNQNDAALSDLSSAIALTKERTDLGVRDVVGGPITPNNLLQERAALYQKMGKNDLAQKDREASASAAGQIFGEMPFRSDH